MAGKKELVLYYRPRGAANPAKLKGVLVSMGIRIRNIQPDQLEEQVGYLAGMEGYGPVNRENKPERFGEAEELTREALVMYQFTEARLEEFLLRFRKAGVPRVELKAVVTQTNAAWSFRQLYQELCREHQEMERQRAERQMQEKQEQEKQEIEKQEQEKRG
ncbi:MAG TPA: DUF3783 domain-containing protein [Candidatus Egerieimonas intestinavium]|uniref:DUF3783 domain-containing protein n=1 Tax=Candidatus Egerieimonas intestinavium TaxID=2840777 RepID=A0A9D1JEP9_9FIRM|nr:DUF3783 domain-containing protein [Candidatus Egerieimonas intestinavium]